MQIIETHTEPDIISYIMRVDKKKGPTHYSLSVSTLDDGWSCNCPDFVYRRAKSGEECKHIPVAKNFHAVKTSHEINVRRNIPFWKRFLSFNSAVRVFNDLRELASFTISRIK